MNLETYAKIGIITGIVLACLVASGFTIMILHHEFNMRFDETLFSIEDAEKKLTNFVNLSDYKIFKEMYPDSKIEKRINNHRVEMTLMQFESTTGNALMLEIRQDYDDKTPYIEAKCDSVKRTSGTRTEASGVMVEDFIKTTGCLNPSQ